MELSWDVYEVSNETAIELRSGCYNHCCKMHVGYGQDEW